MYQYLNMSVRAWKIIFTTTRKAVNVLAAATVDPIFFR